MTLDFYFFLRSAIVLKLLGPSGLDTEDGQLQMGLLAIHVPVSFGRTC